MKRSDVRKETIQDQLKDTVIYTGIVDLGEIVVSTYVNGKELTFLPKVSIVVRTRFKGVHMSRIVESVLMGWLEAEKRRNIEELSNSILKYLIKRKRLIGLEDSELVVKVRGKYIYELMEPCEVILVTVKNKNTVKDYVGVSLTCLNACPCSLSESGGKYTHTQRVKVTAYKLKGKVNEIIKIVESKVTPTRTFLKRDEEVSLIKRAVENPLFVEDIARQLKDEFDLVYVNSLESIHKHNAIAFTCKEELKPWLHYLI